MRNLMRRMRSCACLLTGVVLLAGCVSKPSTFVRLQPLNINGHVKVAIVPFTNLTSERDADKKVTYALITHFLKSSYFDVIPMGETQKAMTEAKVREGEDLALDQIKKIGELTGADVLFMGVVEEYKIDSGTLMGEKIFVPEASICVRLISARTGAIIWSSNHHRRGDEQVTVFGVGRIDSISDLTDVIIKDTFRALAEALKEKQDLLAELKTTHPSPGETPAESATGERTKGVEMEIELLKKEKEALQNELAELKRRWEAVNTAKPEETSIGSGPVVPAAIEVNPPDERELVKMQYEAESVNIKRQY